MNALKPNPCSTNRPPWRDESGFTVPELLMTTLVIGVLAAISTPVWLDQRVGAYDAVAKSDLANAAMEAAFRLNSGDTSVTVEDVGGTGSEGVRLYLLSYEAETGYCLSTQHVGSPNVWYWDSVRGGPQDQGVTCLPVTPQPAGSKRPTGGSGTGPGCDNGVNPGNTNVCSPFPGNGRNGTGHGNGDGNGNGK